MQSKNQTMKKCIAFVFATIILAACNNGSQSTSTTDSTNTTTSTVNPKDWKFGVALWTFHDVDFPTALNRTDSAGLVYIEPNTFVSTGAAFKDSSIGQLSMAGIDKLKSLIT